MTRLYGTGGGDLDRVAAWLRGGELVALPTETVYGLAGDALREEAVRQIFEVKMRPLIDPLIVHVAEMAQVEALAEAPPELELLAAAFWPGPLTVVLPKRPVVLDLVTAGLSTVAVRMPAHPVMREVLKKSGLCLAAPSANPFGYVSPTRAEHVADSLAGRVAHVVDGGGCEHGIESTVLGLQDPQRPVMQLVVRGPQIDHPPTVHLAQPDERRGGDRVQHDLGRRTRLEPGRSGQQLGSGLDLQQMIHLDRAGIGAAEQGGTAAARRRMVESTQHPLSRSTGGDAEHDVVGRKPE